MKSTPDDNQNLVKFLDMIVNPMGKLLGTAAYFIDIRHRRIVRRNLQFAYPRWSKARIHNFSRRVFQNIGVSFLEIFQMFFLSREDILKRARIRGSAYMDEAINNSKGIILISAHIGNWEMANLFASAYYHKAFLLVVRTLESNKLNKWINELRSKFGNKIVYKKGALRHLARELRQGGVAGLLIDQETRTTEAVPVTFFNGTANATPAAALLARRYGCPVIPIFCVREQPDQDLVVIIEPPLPLKKTNDTQSDIKENTQIMTHAIEKIIRAYPEQWFWFHKRWKRHHPELYPEDMARHERRKRKKRARLNKSIKSA